MKRAMVRSLSSLTLAHIIAISFLVVVLNRLGALLEELQLLEEITVVVGQHEASSHEVLHVGPSGYRRFTLFSSSLNHLFPPNENVVLKLKGSHGNLLLFLKVV